jgi:hypothetical protein
LGFNGTLSTVGAFGSFSFPATIGQAAWYTVTSPPSTLTSMAIAGGGSGGSNQHQVYRIEVNGVELYDVYAAADNDSLVDTPTSYGTGNSGGDVRGNYATLNPLQKGSDLTLSNGNLDLAKSSTVDNCTASTIGMTSGKWYFELTITNLGGGEYAIGFGKNIPIQSYMGSNATTWSYADTGSLMTNGNITSYGSSYTTGDILGAAFDGDNGTLTFYKNGTSQGTAATGLTQGPYFFAAGAYNSAATRSANFGQRAFAYPVSGFKALCDTNLGAPVVAKPNTLMDVTLWTGDGASTRTISGLQFSPDFVWIKNRTTSGWQHVLYDTIRGPGTNSVVTSLSTDGTRSEASGNDANHGYLSSFTSDGFGLTKGSQAGGDYVNFNAWAYVAWTWDAGGTTDPSNTAGSITSQVRANVSAGFSIVSWTGTSSSGTIGHGLNVAPAMIIVKCRSTGGTGWPVYHQSLGGVDKVITLQSTAAVQTISNYWNTTAPSSTTFGVASGYDNNVNGATMIAYAFSPVVGYSAMGSYVGNGLSDGSFVYTGFRPRWILIKRSDGIRKWLVFDTARDGYNPDNDHLVPDQSNAEDSTDMIDILSNGFKLRISDADVNGSGATYIYYAVAENPFAYARAR